MFSRPLERLVDDPRAPARWVLLLVLAAGDLALLHRPRETGDWVLLLVAVPVCLAGGAVPAVSATVLAALLVVADTAGLGVTMTVKAMIAIALFELALRAPRRHVLAGSALTGVLLVVHALLPSARDLPPTLYRLSVLAGVPLLFGALIRSYRENARQARAHAAAEERRRRLEAVAARAEERATIARELHDLVAHHVSSMVLRVGVARHVLDRTEDPRVLEVLDDLHESGRTALEDLRRLVAVLRDPAGGGDGTAFVDPARLPEALRDTVDHNRQTGVPTEAAIDPALATLDAARGLTVLRLAQEGLANVARHAGPRATARLSVRLDGDTVRLEITDDGGPSPAAAPGHGLTGMSERVALLGGRLESGPAGDGWRLFAELPARSRKAAPA
ncbi:sensor histidine kinase [Actinomadura kijaniata]|uniref:sensor histidine kinase n=1 Tax=Actinomadura kijaniata TaxID=46161 RepID=UPI003F1B4ADF